MRRAITSRQMDTLRFLAGYQEAYKGIGASYTEIMQGIGRRSKSGITGLLEGLARFGVIRGVGRTRGVEVLVPVTIPRAPDGAPLYAVPGFTAKGDV